MNRENNVIKVIITTATLLNFIGFGLIDTFSLFLNKEIEELYSSSFLTWPRRMTMCLLRLTWFCFSPSVHRRVRPALGPVWGQVPSLPRDATCCSASWLHPLQLPVRPRSRGVGHGGDVIAERGTQRSVWRLFSLFLNLLYFWPLWFSVQEEETEIENSVNHYNN